MPKNYEKHQRDYTILATSLVMEEFLSPRFEKYYSSRTRPMYLLVAGGILHHYLFINEKSERSQNCLKKYSLTDLRNYIKKTDIALKQYRLFIKQKHTDLWSALDRLHDYMKLFVVIIVLCSETPLYQKLDRHAELLLLKTRKRYDDVHKVAMDLQKKLLLGLEKKLNIKSHTLEKLLIGELKNFRRQGLLPQNIQARKNFFFAVHSHSYPAGQEYSRLKAKKIIASLNPKIIINQTKTLSGQIAFPGKAKGKARIINLISEAKNLKKGEILVTAMTDPRYLPLMKKAAAIITDEGGITCHAAIVSRELKKPCIVGTKYASKILRTGDLIEVDAEKGLINLLKRV